LVYPLTLILQGRDLAMPSIAERVRVVSSNIETATKVGEFCEYVRHWAGARGDPHEAAERARAAGALRVAEMYKAAVTPMGTGGALSEYPSTIAAFLAALRSASCFDAMLPSMRRVPARTRLVSASTGATGFIVGEDQIKPLGVLSLAGYQLAEYKAIAIIPETIELVRALDRDAAAFFKDDLIAACAAVTDQKFIQLITSGLTPISSAGVDVTAIWQDIANAFAALDIGASSKIFILVDPSTAAVIATKVTSTGAAAFPGFGYGGGEIAGAKVLVTDGLSAGTLVVADANAIAASSSGTVDLRLLRDGDVQLSTAPDSPTTSASILTNLWQHNMIAPMIERTFGAQLLRTNGCVLVSNLNYRTGNSPA
jgi:HK97 family phage major capsid protein